MANTKTIEKWADTQIDDYQVSDQGRVRSYKGKNARILSPAKDKKQGYLHVNLSDNGRMRYIRIHRLVIISFFGLPEPGQEVNHKNGIKDDNRLDNLEYVTRSQNIRHSIDVLGHKTGACGERHGRTKLTNTDIITIRERCASGGEYATISREYGLTDVAIGKIARGETWQNVGGPLVSESRIGTGSRPRGSANASTKICESDVPEIRKRCIAKEPYTIIAKDYGVNAVTIRAVGRGKIWTHVPGPLETTPRCRRL
jgi:hypothetical protein